MSNWHITRHALSKGILEIPREQCEIDGTYLWWRKPGDLERLFRKGEFFETQAEAQAKAISMAQRRIATSQRAIAKMEKLIAGWEEADAD
jgi:hypothetical protein